ncbi:MAG: threonine synthase [Phycisphaerales bacterium]
MPPNSPAALAPHALQRCMFGPCRAEYPVGRVLTSCPACAASGRQSLLDVVYDRSHPAAAMPSAFAHFLRPDAGGECSGVWQFRELLPFFRSPTDIVSVGEGRTILQKADALGAALGFRAGLFLQYEGLNPTGSFKDNGMTAGFTHARMVGAKAVACASTGNTSASMAMYAAQAGVRAVIFIGAGKIALGKLSQALDYGATTLQVAGDFDACLARVRAVADDPASGLYLLNSVNPFRLEGQKTIMARVLRDLGFGAGGTPPDWVVVPGGNLGNCSAFAKAFIELRQAGILDRLPRLAVINARGARTFDRLVNDLGLRWVPSPHADELGGTYDDSIALNDFARLDRAGQSGRAHTIASAIEINRPVNLPKALRALHIMNGVVRSVDDPTILDYKALVGRHGFGCEPASAASVAGAHLLLREGVIRPDERVVCILTGHQLKDPDATVGYHMVSGGGALSAQPSCATHANRPIQVADDLAAILEVIRNGH